jgi:hypothetical protein
MNPLPRVAGIRPGLSLCVVVSILFAVASAPVSSHHSAAMFDSDETLVLTGVVTKFDYLNPHAWLYVDIANDDGSTTAWGFETSAPPRLRRLGMSPNYWKPGDTVTIKTHPLKDGRPAGSLVGGVKSDGTVYRDAKDLEAPKP